MSRGAKLRELRVVYDRAGAPGRRMMSSRDVHGFLLGAVPSLAYQTDESFFVLALDARLRIVAWSELFRGPMTACPVDPASVFRWALMAGAVSIVIAHSHPSGCPQASPEDVALTRRLVDAGRIIGIEILDHVIVGDATSYFSLLDAGLLQPPQTRRGCVMRIATEVTSESGNGGGMTSEQEDAYVLERESGDDERFAWEAF